MKRHCNGQEWEKREFLCGYVIEWTPNFSSETRHHGCCNSPTYKAAIKRVTELKEQRTQLDASIRDAETAAYTEVKSEF